MPSHLPSSALPSHGTRLEWLIGNALLALAYALMGWAALQLAIPPGYTAPLFPPAGLALGAVMVYGWRLLPGIFLGSILVQMLASEQSGLSLSLNTFQWIPALGATLQAWVGQQLAQRWLSPNPALDTPESVGRFVTLVAPLGCLINASIAIPMLHYQGAMPTDAVPFNWVSWWIGDTLGVLITLPLFMVLLGQPASLWRPRRTVVTLPLLGALSLLTLSFFQMRDWEEKRISNHFQRSADHLISLITKRLDAQIDQVIALERLAYSHPNITHKTWQEFTQTLLERHPGTQNFGWSPLVQHSERIAFERWAKQQTGPHFQILGRTPDGQTHPAPKKDEYLPILFVEPLAKNVRAQGLDPLVLPQTRTAALLTRQNRRPVASESIRLVQEVGEQRGVVVYQAVFQPNGQTQRGMISSVFRMDDTINHTLGKHLENGLQLCLFDPTAAPGRQRLYGRAACEQAPLANTLPHYTHAIPFAERHWLLRITATPAYLNQLRSINAWLILAFSLFGAGTLGAFLLLTSGKTQRTEALVHERTRQLAEASQDLQKQQAALCEAQRLAQLGSWETDPDTGIYHCSEELRARFDWSSDAVIREEQLLAALHPEDRPALAFALQQVALRPETRVLDARLHAAMPPYCTLQFRIESLPTRRGALHIRGTAQDVTSTRDAAAHIAYLAHYDLLTGLPNRTSWNKQLHSELQKAQRHKDLMAVLFLDLDQFKSVNDSLGHPVGDQLLTNVARRLSACLREEDYLARLGGDEFVLLLPRLQHQEDAARVAQKLLESLRTPIAIESHELSISVSIGIALFPEDGQDADTLLKHADIAMYFAKEQGRNTVHFFTADMDAHAMERLNLENALRKAVDRGEFHLHYQPQINSSNGQITGCEALLRWQHPDMGAVSPAKFIPIAEASGLILPIGRWVLREACAQQVRWAAAGMPLVMAINISAVQFRQSGFTEEVRSILSETGAQPQFIELELTESTLMLPTPEVIQRMETLRSWGIELALDDFGTGYSSLSYLKKLPIHRLKIDRSFVQDVPSDPEDVAIATATLSLARELGMQVVAEGVENTEQRDFLTERGCDLMQGYLYSRPLPAEELATLVRRQQEMPAPDLSHPG